MSQLPIKQIASGAVGAQSLAASTQAEGRAAIGSTPATYNPTLVSSFPGTVINGSIIQTPDGGIWKGNHGEWRLLGVDADPISLINANRGLLFNGGCTLPPKADAGGVLRVPGWGHAGDVAQTYETPVQAWPNDSRYGRYSLKTASPNHLLNDYAFPVEAGVVYGYYISIKVDIATTNKWYASIYCFDEDGAQIKTIYFNRAANSHSYLSRTLSNGDSTAYVHRFRDPPTNTQSVTGWATASDDSYLRYLAVYNDVSTGGMNYPSWVNESPTEPAFTRRVRNYSSITTVGNEFEIALSLPWSSGVAPSGTPVANNQDGATFDYPWANVAYPAPGVWTDYIPTVSSWRNGTFAVGGAGSIMPLRPYTRTVRAGVLLNYYLSQNTTTLFHAQILPM